MEVGSSIEEYFLKYSGILKDWMQARDEDVSDIFIFILGFKNPIEEVIEDMARSVKWLKAAYGSFLIKKKPLVQEPKK